ncbi:MAG: superoxide dismutase family protein [Candidatus Rokubacteria bacterium]|nr:superoxide dismutase family protein [Candidatus Rokubacteria bacterium]
MKPATAVAALALFLAGCATATTGGGATATAEMKNANGQTVGTATFTEVSGGVRVVLEARDLPPGEKGVHIHAVGKCDPPQFTTAGGHFNPAGKQHGTLNPQGPHAGDLPNIVIGANGTGRLETFTDRVALSAGANSLFDADGSALVIHASPDDFKTDPTGNSGGRIACGLIVKK